MSILPFADPETLKSLNLFSLNENMGIEMDEIVKTEQWKEAKSIRSKFCGLNMTVEDICHVSAFDGKMLQIFARDLEFLKKTFTTSFKSVWWELRINDFNENEEISNLWGPAFIKESSSYWYFRIKDSNEKCLKLELRDNIFNFIFIKLNDVPHGAVVHDYNEN
ncbi:hypothetical protein B9Z55_021280 [Caenorhabditis nigoni]|uniref:DUF38 domain-containing protein n=1 Tax=Caenorhabditis nigoni TaxID=1611254 RepID=A0A2G5TR80_9PELO|nr:hypothetical protein B9Z55_021280 [Caenorhabditis nigoni]